MPITHCLSPQNPQFAYSVKMDLGIFVFVRWHDVKAVMLCQQSALERLQERSFASWLQCT